METTLTLNDTGYLLRVHKSSNDEKHSFALDTGTHGSADLWLHRLTEEDLRQLRDTINTVLPEQLTAEVVNSS